jgi:hypothetical protein
MQWLSQNWFWVFIFVAFIAMHLFGHGCHGGHGGHGRRQERPEPGKEGSKDGGQKQHHHH